jgi:hypothetical protein
MTNFHGLIPAMAVPFRPDFSIDEQELACGRRRSRPIAKELAQIAEAVASAGLKTAAAAG